MNYEEAHDVLSGIIGALRVHVDMAKQGIVSDECVVCRERDLEEYEGILDLMERQHRTLMAAKENLSVSELGFITLAVPPGRNGANLLMGLLKGECE